MRKLVMAASTAVALSVPSLLAGSANAMPLAGISPETLPAASLVQKTQLYVYEGRNYCYYGDGWHGPGYYWCNYAWRRGYGWGGIYGWNGWGRPGYAYRGGPGPGFYGRPGYAYGYARRH